MAVTSVTEHPESPSGKTSSDGTRSYERKFIVTTSTVNDGPQVVLGAAGVPAPGTLYAFGNDVDILSYATTTSASRMDAKHRNLWLATVTYTTKKREENEEQTTDNPLDEPAKISGTATLYQSTVEEDIHGDKIVNSAGDPFGEPLQKDDGRPTLSISKNYSTVDISKYVDFLNTLNNGQFWGLGKGKWKMRSFQWERQYYNGTTPFYTVTFEFEARLDGWSEQLVDMGVLNKAGNFHQDEKGESVTQAVPMDGAGEKLGIDPATSRRLPLVFIGAAGGVVSKETDKIEIYYTRDFSTLGVPTSLS